MAGTDDRTPAARGANLAIPAYFLCTLEEEEHYRQWERRMHAEYALDVLAARAAL